MVDDDKVSRDLKPSQELLEKIVEARDLAKRFGQSAIEIVKQAYELAIRDGFHPLQARDFLIAQLPFLGESTIRKALPPEAKEQSKVRLRSNVAQNPEPKEPNTVNITTKATIQDADLVKKDPPPEDKPLTQEEEIEWRDFKISQLEDALHKVSDKQFVTATELQEQRPAKAPNPTPELQMTDDLVFQYLRDRAKETGNILIIDRVGAGALVQALSQYKNSFGVAELFLRIIK
jgi:hypothetical protein